MVVIMQPGLVVEILPRKAQRDFGVLTVEVGVFVGGALTEGGAVPTPHQLPGGIAARARGAEVVGVKVGDRSGTALGVDLRNRKILEVDVFPRDGAVGGSLGDQIAVGVVVIIRRSGRGGLFDALAEGVVAVARLLDAVFEDGGQTPGGIVVEAAVAVPVGERAAYGIVGEGVGARPFDRGQVLTVVGVAVQVG